MNKQKYILLITGFFLVLFSHAQEKEQIEWHDPAKAGFKTVHNQLWTGAEIASFYDRLPARAEPLVRKPVWGLSRNAAGLKLVFKTNATDITVRYVVAKKNYAMDHFPATGVSGVDLFAPNADGTWEWANGKYAFKDTITYTFSGMDAAHDRYPDGREFHLYLPLYNSVEWMEIGVSTEHSFAFVPATDEKPIIVYGTSIAQGGCASRAGMAWTSLLERAVHVPVVNLAFSGNGRLEKELVDLIVEHEARVFVLDCIPNLGGEAEAIVAKTIDAVHTIRSRYPNTPIVLVEHSGYQENRMSSARIKSLRLVNEKSQQAYEELQAEGIKDLHYLTYEEIGLDQYDSVDGTHPTDGGMLKYAKAYETLLKRILN